MFRVLIKLFQVRHTNESIVWSQAQRAPEKLQNEILYNARGQRTKQS